MLNYSHQRATLARGTYNGNWHPKPPPTIGKTWTIFFPAVLSMFWVITRIIQCSKKNTVLSNSVTCCSRLDYKKWKNGSAADLTKRQNNISQICVSLWQCKPSIGVTSSITHLCAKIGALDPSNNRYKASWNFGCSRSFTKLCSTKTFRREGPFFDPTLSRLSRIIVDIITSSSLLPVLSWALECKTLKFHTSGLFSL